MSGRMQSNGLGVPRFLRIRQPRVDVDTMHLPCGCLGALFLSSPTAAVPSSGQQVVLRAASSAGLVQP